MSLFLASDHGVPLPCILLIGNVGHVWHVGQSYTVFCKFYIKQTPTEESYHSILLAMEDLSLTSTLCHNMRVEGHGTMDRLEKAPNIYIWPLPPLLHLSRVMDRCRAIGSWSHCKYLLISHSTTPPLHSPRPLLSWSWHNIILLTFSGRLLLWCADNYHFEVELSTKFRPYYKVHHW